jgi:hypothetical protein
MSIRALIVAVALSVALSGVASAQPGTVFIEGQGGALIPVGEFHHEQHIGGAYSIAAGYEMLEVLDLMLQFTHSFNDNKNSFDTFSGPGFVGHSNETEQNFIVGTGPRFDFLPSDYRVRPFGLFQVEWDHFARFNHVDFNGRTLISDDDQDAFGIQAGLGIEGTIFELYEHRGDKYPLLELTVGVNGSYHHAFHPNRPDKQFVTTLASFGVRF